MLIPNIVLFIVIKRYYHQKCYEDNEKVHIFATDPHKNWNDTEIKLKIKGTIKKRLYFARFWWPIQITSYFLLSSLINCAEPSLTNNIAFWGCNKTFIFGKFSNDNSWWILLSFLYQLVIPIKSVDAFYFRSIKSFL